MRMILGYTCLSWWALCKSTERTYTALFVQNDTPFYALVVVALHLDTLYIDKLCFRT